MSFGEVQNYQGALGAIDMIGASHDIFIKVYNDIGSAITNGDVYFLSYLKDADSLTVSARPTLDALATTAVYRQVVVVNNSALGKATIADQDYGYVQVKGYCPDVNTDVTSVAIDRFLQGKNATATAADDGTTITTDSFAITVAAIANTSHIAAILFGQRTLIG
jgi:hypothetical protein